MATLVRVALSISLAVSVAAVFVTVVSVVLFFEVNIRGGVLSGVLVLSSVIVVSMLVLQRYWYGYCHQA